MLSKSWPALQGWVCWRGSNKRLKNAHKARQASDKGLPRLS